MVKHQIHYASLEEWSKKYYDEQFTTVITHKNVQNYYNEKCEKYYVWPKKAQGSYLSLHWRVMQNLKKNWLVVWKMTGIWHIFTRAIERLRIGILMGSFHPK